MTTRRAGMPAPEIVVNDGKAWMVKDSGNITTAATSRDSRELLVPFKGDPAIVRAIRAHELGHLRFSPAANRGAKGVHPMLLNAAEDGRVNTLLEKAGIDLSALPGTDGVEIDGADPMTPAMLAGLAVARFGTGTTFKILETTDLLLDDVAAGAVRETVHECLRLYRRGLRRKLGYRNAVKAARLLMRLLPVPPEKPGSDALRETGKGTRPLWGRMDIETPPLPMSTRNLSRRPSYTTEGCTPTAMHRLPIDGSVFRRTVAARTCSVLVDCSGSMSWDTDALLQLVRAISGATVALYSGDAVHCTSGPLRIVASKGHATFDPTTVNTMPGCNIIDGPALRWLARQPAPRYWVSDGQVTGYGERMEAIHAFDVACICKAGRIERVNDAAHLLARLKIRPTR